MIVVLDFPEFDPFPDLILDLIDLKKIYIFKIIKKE